MQFITRLVAALVFLNLAAACNPPKDTLPDELHGVWTTSDPRYAGRFFWLNSDFIVFKTGQDSVSTHRIIKILKAPNNEGVLYTLAYANQDGKELWLSFVYDVLNGGVIRFKNQNDVLWNKLEH